MTNEHASDLDRAILALNNRIASAIDSLPPTASARKSPDLMIHVRIADLEAVIGAARDAQIAAHESRAARTITIDLATGDWVDSPKGGITGEEGQRVAAAVLPGMPVEEVERAYGAYMSEDPAPADSCEGRSDADLIETVGQNAARVRAERLRAGGHGIDAGLFKENGPLVKPESAVRITRPSTEDATVMHIAGDSGATLCGKRNVSHRTNGRRYADCPVCIAAYDQIEGVAE